ncbi:MAG TPA: tRNA (guanosine(37)-N1)-methyltransferase TrmD [Holophagaceae bacterium]|jgi:tRNA (guanine37-N1)-methyltransferase|nr:tRNA (guanosine(37)-N1)-methyltransferase TrmD [Holophagaceae bacterium]
MRFDALTLFPEFFDAARLGVTGRAFRELGHELHTHNYRPFAGNATGHVDDTPYGGGPGMVLRPEVLRDTLASVPRAGNARIIHFSPAAPPLRHADVRELAGLDQVLLVCTRYEGLDQRAVDRFVDQEFSVGEAVLSGGELPALFLIDAVCRWLPGVLGNEASAGADSFAGGLLDHPHFTKPATFEELAVPAVLQSGDHGAIHLWRLREAMARTKRLRPDLWVAFLAERRGGLSRPEQWAAWQVEHPETWDLPKPKSWKGWPRE